MRRSREQASNPMETMVNSALASIMRPKVNSFINESANNNNSNSNTAADVVDEEGEEGGEVGLVGGGSFRDRARTFLRRTFRRKSRHRRMTNYGEELTRKWDFKIERVRVRQARCYRNASVCGPSFGLFCFRGGGFTVCFPVSHLSRESLLLFFIL